MVEKLHIPLIPRMLILPSNVVENVDLLPESAMRIFYDKRVNDVNDGLRKYKGFVPSQVGFSWGLMKGMLSPQ